MKKNHRWLNIGCGVTAVICVASALNRDVENIVGLMVVLALALPFLVVLLRELIAEVVLWWEFRDANSPPNPDDVAAWLKTQPPRRVVADVVEQRTRATLAVEPVTRALADRPPTVAELEGPR